MIPELFMEDQEYTIIKGDTYTSIARKFYGDVICRKEIMKANDYIDLLEGETLIIPPLIGFEEYTFARKDKGKT